MMRRPVAALPLVAFLLPALGTLYQFAAMMTARASATARTPAAWIAAAAANPWFWLLLASEAASFLIWTAILARIPLSRAFPLSAIGYVLVFAMAVVAVHEPLRPAAIAGSVAILAGAALLATDAP